MFLPSGPKSTVSLIGIEIGLTVITSVVAFAFPRLGSSSFSRIECAFGRLARRRGLAVVVVGLSALLLRLAFLPLFPIPLPFIPDDFSFLLAADTFAHGRLTNPTPAMWSHFESIHITMQPTYASMYFPAQGLVLAGGKILFGHPWFGILCTSALMCAAICWMLQAWIPPTWALLGGILAVLRLGLFSYWINTYTGAGALSALGGALVVGALPRLMKRTMHRHAILLAVGIVLLASTRPYEGLLLCLPVAAVLGHWVIRGHNRPPIAVLACRAAIPLVLIMATFSWMGYYNYRSFGSPLTLPYTADRATYAMAPYYAWQSPRPEPTYRHKEISDFYHGELGFFQNTHSIGFVRWSVVRVLISFLFLAGGVLLPPMIMIRRALIDRRIRFLVVSSAIFAAGMAVGVFLLPHYLAPFTATFYAIGLQAMRHLRLWKPEKRPIGLALVRLTVGLCVLLAGVRVFAQRTQLAPREWPTEDWVWHWYGPQYFGTERARIESLLESFPGKHLVVVRYSSRHEPLDEWVYNSANIDGSKIIWSREMDPASNQKLLVYYKDRKAWLVEPDLDPAALSPFTVLSEPAILSRSSVTDSSIKSPSRPESRANTLHDKEPF